MIEGPNASFSHPPKMPYLGFESMVWVRSQITSVFPGFLGGGVCEVFLELDEVIFFVYFLFIFYI